MYQVLSLALVCVSSYRLVDLSNRELFPTFHDHPVPLSR